MEGHKNYAGLKYKDWRKPKKTKFVNACSPSTVQALYSLTCLRNAFAINRCLIKKPPPSPSFWKKLDDKQAYYFTWPKAGVICNIVNDKKP